MFWKIIFINFLTFLRIVGTLIIIPIYHFFGGFYAGIISLFCYATDSLDGILARKWHASTFFGALFDGVSDKMLTLANFILLYLITPYALIPIIFEISIIFVQLFKYYRHLNIKSNIIGKSKVWILAICIVLTFFLSDLANVPLLSLNFKESLMNLSQNKLYFYLLLPAIIMEALTLISYILEIFNPPKMPILHHEPKAIIIPKMNNKTKWEKIKNIWLNPEYYEEHKNDS